MHAAASCGKGTRHFSQCSRISKGMAFLESYGSRLRLHSAATDHLSSPKPRMAEGFVTHSGYRRAAHEPRVLRRDLAARAIEFEDAPAIGPRVRAASRLARARQDLRCARLAPCRCSQQSWGDTPGSRASVGKIVGACKLEDVASCALDLMDEILEKHDRRDRTAPIHIQIRGDTRRANFDLVGTRREQMFIARSRAVCVPAAKRLR